MKKYKINYSVTIEAETQQDAVNIFFDSVPQNGVMQCSVSDDGKDACDILKRIADDMDKMTKVGILHGEDAKRFERIIKENETKKVPTEDYERAKKAYQNFKVIE